MDELTLLKPKLVRLKLSGMLETLSARVQQAMDERWSYSNFLDILLADEVDRRDHKQLTRRLLKSTLEPGKTLESFDFSFNPRLPGSAKAISPRPSATRLPGAGMCQGCHVPSRRRAPALDRRR
jgi:DNA replication protein DnaC